MSATFWAEHQVGGPYATIEESSRALRDRLLRYPKLLKLMPVNYPGQKVLDYGCGPGHDTILFSQLGATVSYWDTSHLALETTYARLQLHGLPATRHLSKPFVPLYDHVHCAGVLHHVEDPHPVLADLRQYLKRDGTIRLMVYDGEESTHSQSEVPVTHWWTRRDIQRLCRTAGLKAEYRGSYECSTEWRPDCYAACYELWR